MYLELKDVNQLFNKKKLLSNNVDLIVKQSKATLLYGGSGSGKTSIFNVLIGLVNPYEGEVFWNEKKINILSEANKIRSKYMSVVFSNFSFIRELNIKENILLASSLCKVKDATIHLKFLQEELLNFKSIDENIDLSSLIAKGSIQQLSNGQKEIVSIASTLLLQTKFIVADELFRSFPDKTKELLFKRLLKYFKENEIGFFYVTHWTEAQRVLQESGFESEIYLIENQKFKRKEI